MKVKYPYSRAYVEITNICKRNCSFCPGTKRAPRRMNLTEFSHILDELEGLTEYIYLHVMGEPLTHPELCEFISIASSRGFKCAITTNGTLLKNRPEILDSGVYKINISVHSFEKGTEEEFLAYVRSIMDFADESSRRGILTILRLWNKGYDEGRNIDILALLADRFSDEEWHNGPRGSRLRNKLHLEYGERFDWPDAACKSLGDDVFCYGLSDHFGILSDGRVIPCCLDREAEIDLGNVYEKSLAEILSSERSEAIRKGFKQKRAVEQLCKKCGYARRFKL